MAFSKAGKLWGIDFRLRLIDFNLLTKAVKLMPPLIKNFYVEEISNLQIIGENDFWFSAYSFGLFHYNSLTKKITEYKQGIHSGSLPVTQLMNMVPDPDDPKLLWIASLGGGLIKFDTKTGKCNDYTTQNGLPDNTVYLVMLDAQKNLWCSSNHGIFLFNRTNGIVRSFTINDGLGSNEFNRYHFISLPGGSFAYGGIDGYTVFNPLKLVSDRFKPYTSITGIKINDKPADYGDKGSLLKQPVNSLSKLTLSYGQNFITLNFSASEYNIPEKIQYRYMIPGYNASWIYSGNQNTAVYTDLPPGKYLFKVNASNTSGIWSDKVRSLEIIIKPPF